MKRALLFLLFIPLSVVLVGCAEMSPDDREFFGRGWIKPTELDKERPTQMPSHPETTGSLGAAGPVGQSASGRADTSGGGWTPDDYQGHL